MKILSKMYTLIINLKCVAICFIYVCLIKNITGFSSQIISMRGARLDGIVTEKFDSNNSKFKPNKSLFYILNLIKFIII